MDETHTGAEIASLTGNYYRNKKIDLAARIFLVLLFNIKRVPTAKNVCVCVSIETGSLLLTRMTRIAIQVIPGFYPDVTQIN